MQNWVRIRILQIRQNINLMPATRRTWLPGQYSLKKLDTLNAIFKELFDMIVMDLSLLMQLKQFDLPMEEV